MHAGAPLQCPIMFRVRLLQIASLLFLMQVGACDCQEDLEDLNPSIDVLPTPVDFLFRRVDADSALPVTIFNKGTAPLNIASIKFEPEDAPFTVEALPEIGIEQVTEGGTAEFRLVFH